MVDGPRPEDVKHTIDHIWFDLHGTLSPETEEYKAALVAVSHTALADALGVEVDDAIRDLFDRLYRQYGTKSAIFEALGMNKDYWPSRFAQLDQLHYMHANPEISEALNQLAALRPVSLLSNARLEMVAAALQAIDIPITTFTHILTSSDVRNPKPALDGFRLIVACSGVPAERILFVGDREPADIRPARAVGMRTVLMWGTSSIADHCFATFRDVVRLFS
jgi:HAD superfamily hydrolase (TIGR01549 family)